MVTSPKIIFLVVASLIAVVLGGLGCMFYLVLQKVDAAMIALISGPTLTALGGLMSILNNTRTQAAPASNPPNPPDGGSVPVTVINPPQDPVPTTTQPESK